MDSFQVPGISTCRWAPACFQMSSPPADGVSAGHRWRKVPVCPNSFFHLYQSVEKIWGTDFSVRFVPCGVFEQSHTLFTRPTAEAWARTHAHRHVFMETVFPQKHKTDPNIQPSVNVLFTAAPVSCLLLIHLQWGRRKWFEEIVPRVCSDLKNFNWSYWLPVNRAVARLDQICLLF